jgi:hypothetical protein
MALDLSRVITQITDMVFHLKADTHDRLEHVESSVKVLHQHAEKLDPLRKKISRSRTTWLVAEPVEQLDCKYSSLPIPKDFVVVATDGSHIDVDRHHGVRCFLINTGAVTLQYGSQPDAILESEPHIYYQDADLVITTPDNLREIPVEGNLLGARRAVEECRKLSDTMSGLPADFPALGLIDGSLLLWTLEGSPDYVVETILDKGYLKQLDEMRKLCATRQAAVASYISLPRGNDVINMLRVALCPREAVDSDRCGECETRECYSIAGVRDRDLFMQTLAAGERSALFISHSKVQKRYGPHLVHFFYLKLDDEIARVELPMWIATDKTKLDLTHALILDQCKKGQGYPVALSEAHEKAVITGADRENFWSVVESLLVKENISLADSAKSTSKKRRSI